MTLAPALAVQGAFLRQVLRARAPAAFAALVVLAAVLLPRLAEGDASELVRLQVAVAYGAGLPVFLAAVATAVLAAGAVAREVESRRIHLVATKPAPAWQVVLGKAGAIAVLDALLLAAVLAALAASLLLAGPRGGGGVAPGDAERARERFFAARASARPVLASLDEDAVRRVAERRAEEEPRWGERSEAERHAWARRVLRSTYLRPGESAELRFQGLPAPRSTGETLVVRFGVYSARAHDAPRVRVRWEARGAETAAATLQVLHGVPQEASLPAACIEAGGTLRLALSNAEEPDSGLTVVLDPEEVELLVPAGGFWPNALRAFAILFLQLLLVAGLGLLASCLFTFPTAALAALFLYGTSLAAGYLRETFALRAAAGRPESLADWIEAASAAFGSAVFRLLPDVASFDPIARLEGGRAVTLAELGLEGGALALKAAAALAIGAFALSRRELGR
ncbi:MAG: hypothetical protein HY721_07140 [Planctomycetes bacterium]|nr:hypothetical protein [Planctomycetota bacterium]